MAKPHTKKPLKTGQGISRTDAVRFVNKHRLISNLLGKGTIHVTFTVAEIQEFINDFTRPGDLLRIYFGRNDDNDRTAVIVAARPMGNHTEELTAVEDPDTIVGRDFGTLCPPQCDFDFDTGSIAFEVFKGKAARKK